MRWVATTTGVNCALPANQERRSAARRDTHTQARVPSAVDAATLRILVNGSALSAFKSV